MISYEKAKKIAFESLERIENVRILTDVEKKEIFPNSDAEGWEVITEILGPDKVQREIRLYLIFPQDFPLSFPKVFLGNDDYEKIKFIPHVEVSRLVCTFDNLAKPHPDFPGEVVVQTVRKAKRIIEEGINEVNTSDFDDEFIAYWESKYSDKDAVLTNVLLLFEEPLNSNIKLIELKSPISKISYIIHQEESIAIRFKNFLADFGRKFTESEGLFIGELTEKIRPPFDFTNKAVIQLVKGSTENFDNYQTYLNNHSYPKLVLFSKKIRNELRYFGWSHNRPILERNGFRPGSLSPFKVLSTFECNQHVKRISPEILNDSRLNDRSAGAKNLQSKSRIYSVAGIGSIGSNLVHFLKSDHGAEFRLVDKDFLEIENLGRHLLGFEYVNTNKAFALKEYLNKNNPTRKVKARDVSIYNIIEHEPEYINESNILIVCIGEENIEKWIADRLEAKVISVPILFVWVEPYLLGGHCIYITPSNNDYNDFFDESGLFKFNIIDKNEYLSGNPVLFQREAGCQTNFTPYSADRVLSFLGALYPYISEIIQNSETSAKCFSWAGDRSIHLKLGLGLSKYGKAISDGLIKQNNL